MSAALGSVTVDTSPLFSPFTLKSLTLGNRFVMPGMQRGWCAEGAPLPQMVDYYRRRVEGGVSLVISESCAVDHPTSTGQPAAAYIDSATVEPWSRCIEAVHGAGGNMLIQLWHEGALRPEGLGGKHPHVATLSPSGLVHAGRENGRAASLDDLEELKAAYVRSALFAREAGADGVEVHAAHGYLMDQFLWATTNRLGEGYGGEDIAARVRFPAEVVAAIRQALGPEPVISFRLSQWKEADYDARIVETPAELATLLSTLRSAGVDVFHVSTRYFWRPEWPGSELGFAGWCKSLTDAPVVTVGSVGLDLDVMTSLLDGPAAKLSLGPALEELVTRFDRGEFDLVAVGRSNISDPDWVKKVRDGRYTEIRAFDRADIEAALEWENPFVEDAHAARAD
jgi:2,4-dienoyl-CoA reductase-like NADH-dependent reductase (Old Yellow Enzyme family)